ncbi:hypothetical protein ACHAQJ_002967 [Trichoderma viride]
MPDLFCCPSIKPYRPRRLDHEEKFDRFMQWAKFASSNPSEGYLLITDSQYAVQLVKQVNFGSQESIRYFIPASNGIEYVEITESNLLEANFKKLNSYKNFKCGVHNRFFEVNLYQKNPTNAHHWRADLARPSKDIDLLFKERGVTTKTSVEVEPITPPLNQERSASGLKSFSSPFQTDRATVKSVLRFLLPTVKTNLGSRPLVSLLCLDWVNVELDLGLDMENDWEAQLTSDNIAAFIHDCSELSAGNLVNLTEVENLVNLVVSSSSFTQGQITGQKKLQEIVDTVFQLGAASSWVSKCREDTMHMFTAGPNEQLLQLCQHKDAELQTFCSWMGTKV